MFSKSLETLAVRMYRHCKSAERILNIWKVRMTLNKKLVYPFLKSHPQYEIAKQQMKNGGALLTFELEVGLNEDQSFLNGLNMCSLTANLGDTKTIVTHPASITHSRMSEEDRLSMCISDSFKRISVGLENIEDIIKDIDQALLRIK